MLRDANSYGKAMKGGDLIFKEPPEDLDETWTHGAVLGGMSGYSDESLAHSYFVAGAALIDHALSSDDGVQEFICPILYLSGMESSCT